MNEALLQVVFVAPSGQFGDDTYSDENAEGFGGEVHRIASALSGKQYRPDPDAHQHQKDAAYDLVEPDVLLLDFALFLPMVYRLRLNCHLGHDCPSLLLFSHHTMKR